MNEHIPPQPDRKALGEKLRRTDRPYMVLKAGATLDGKIATAGGLSQWITGEAARAHSHGLRASCGAVLVGINTVLADDPRLNVRTGGSETVSSLPARIVLDSTGRIPLQSRCLAADGARRLVVLGSTAGQEIAARLAAQGVEVIRCPTPRPAPEEFLPRLREAGLECILVEGGGKVHAALIAQGEADELFLYMGGMIFGGAAAPAWCDDLMVAGPDEAPRIQMAEAMWFPGPQGQRQDLLLHGYFQD